MAALDEVTTQFDYDYEEIKNIPDRMKKWRLKVESNEPTTYGKYSLVEITPAYIEMHHQVEVIDEAGDALRGVWVMFGYHTGHDYGHLVPDVSHWGEFGALKGNMVKTNAMGYAQHTYGDGGETIFIWDTNEEKVQKLSSDVVRNCKWLSAEKDGQSPDIPFNHTGVRLVFQRRVKGIPVRSQRKRIEQLEQSLAALKETWSDDRMTSLMTRIDQREQKLENLELRIKVLELELKAGTA